MDSKQIILEAQECYNDTQQNYDYDKSSFYSGYYFGRTKNLIHTENEVFNIYIWSGAGWGFRSTIIVMETDLESAIKLIKQQLKEIDLIESWDEDYNIKVIPVNKRNHFIYVHNGEY